MGKKTELRWTHDPENFFEEELLLQFGFGDLAIASGSTVVTLRESAFPVPEEVRSQVADTVLSVFDIRKLVTHSSYKLEGPTVYHEDGESRHIAIAASAAVLTLSAVASDIVIKDAAGNVIQDSKAERIAEHNRILREIVAHSSNPVLRQLIKSYAASVDDVKKELVHLYEIRDALKAHFGSEQAAKATLRAASEYSDLGKLSNDKMIEEGRHHGQSLGRGRPATDAELNLARQAARSLVLKYTQHLEH